MTPIVSTTNSGAKLRKPCSLTSFCVFLCLFALFTGCATQPGQPPGNQKNLNQLNNWQIEGKLGFRSPQKNGSAWLRWHQQNSAYELHLNGPFGAASTQISGDKDFALLTQSGQENLSAESGEALSAQLFGWPFPVSELAYWVKGMPAPGSRAETTFNDQNLLTALRQQNWQLELSEYAAFGDWTLPTRIKGKQGGLGFTLVINRWETLPSPTLP